MTYVPLQRPTPESRETLSRLVAEVGAWRVLGIAAVALLRGQGRPRRPVGVERLNGHLLRDVGLPQHPPARPYREFRF